MTPLLTHFPTLYTPIEQRYINDLSCYSVTVHYLGLDIGGTELKAGVVDEDGRILKSARRPSEPQDLARLIDSINELLTSVSIDATPRAVGVGVPGMIATHTGEVLSAFNVPSLNGAHIGALIGKNVGLPVVVKNDADMNAWGEFKVGAGVGALYMAGLTVGTGLGSALIVHGKLYTGTAGYGIEAGHTVVEPDGRLCSCGSRGCLETVASAKGIVESANEGIATERPTSLTTIVTEGKKSLTAKTVLEAAVDGDEFAASIYANAGRYLGIGCANLINLLNLELIVIGGGIAGAGQYLLNPIIEEARSRTNRGAFDVCRIVSTTLDGNAGIIGAALFAADHTFQSKIRR